MSTGCKRPEKVQLVKSTAVDNRFSVLGHMEKGQGKLSRVVFKQKTKQSEVREVPTEPE